jgi:hypothetical protein
MGSLNSSFAAAVYKRKERIFFVFLAMVLWSYLTRTNPRKYWLFFMRQSLPLDSFVSDAKRAVKQETFSSSLSGCRTRSRNNVKKPTHAEKMCQCKQSFRRKKCADLWQIGAF